MHIKTQLSEKDYLRASIHMLYRKTSTRIVTGIGIILLLLNLALMFWGIDDGSISGIIIPIILLVLSPAMVFWNVKRTYKANKRVREKTEYRFDDSNLFIKGETYESRVEWSNIPKVTVTKEWVILWVNKVQGYIIPRKDFWDGELHDLKNILNDKGISNNI